MTTQAERGFLDSIAARLLALCIALGLAIVLVQNYKEDFQRVLSGEQQTSGLPTTSTETSPEEAADPALAECLQQRIGDVDRMKEEGILNDQQFASFRARAEELCIQQHS